MQIREASEKWNISERRIRQLIQDERIESTNNNEKSPNRKYKLTEQ